jgi:pentose-5-phosphate-3-epimerase
MLPEPSHEVRRLIELGATRIVIHADAPLMHARHFEMLQETREGEFAVNVGIALAAHDMPEVLEAFKGLYDYVQVMGIEHIGKQGEPFDPHHHEIIKIAHCASVSTNSLSR